MERQEFQLLHKLDRTFSRTQKEIYKVAVEIVVDVHAADLRLHAEQERATSAERLQVQFWSWREHLPAHPHDDGGYCTVLGGKRAGHWNTCFDSVPSKQSNKGGVTC